MNASISILSKQLCLSINCSFKYEWWLILSSERRCVCIIICPSFVYFTRPIQSMDEISSVLFPRLEKIKRKKHIAFCFQTSVCLLLLFFRLLCVLEALSHTHDAEEAREREKTYIRPAMSLFFCLLFISSLC